MNGKNRFGSDYVSRIEKIWKLNQPPIDTYNSETGLYSVFKTQYEQVRTFSAENSDFTRTQVLPLLQKTDSLSNEEIDHIYEFAGQLFSMDSLGLTDGILCLKLYQRLLEEPDISVDPHQNISISRHLLQLIYHVCDTFRRAETPYSKDLQSKYRSLAQHYFDGIRQYLLPENFSTLSTETKNDLLILQRLMSLFWYPHPDDIRETVHTRLACASEVLAYAKNESYHHRSPDVNWEREIGASLYYVTICGSIIYHGDPVLQEDLQKLYDACLEQCRRIEEGKLIFTDASDANQMLSYMRYLFQEISPDDYLKEISAEYFQRDRNRYDVAGITENVYRPAQILEVLVHHLDKPEHIKEMEQLYQDLIRYSFHMPTNEFQEIFLVYTLIALNCFQEIEGGITFSQLCDALLANCSPATYVHSHMVGKISRLLATKLASTQPELFIGLLTYKTCEEVREHAAEFGQLLFDCGIYHDIGKLPYLDTIGVTYRSLFDDEFEIIKLHPFAGYNLLKQYNSTRLFADAALGHHKWYDDSRGYPEEYHRSSSAAPILVDIIAVADCLDAATDIIFRSYSRGITLEDFIKEARDGAGTRYSPYVVSVFDHPDIIQELSVLLNEGREQTYLTAYKLLPPESTPGTK